MLAADDTGYLYDLFRKAGLSQFGARTLNFLVIGPIRALLILVTALIVTRIAARWIRRSIRGLQLRTDRLLTTSPRAEQRATTIAEVLVSTMKIAVWAVAILIVFDQLGINLAPLLAGAGIAGIAVGFGAQSIVRDVLSGFFILIEDQYGVGDSVDLLPDVAGTVEEVNLRVTRLRAPDGRVMFVPNGEIRRVANGSIAWNKAMVDIPVRRDEDIRAARQVVEEEAAALADDPAWADRLLEPPEVLGVETLTHEFVAFRVAVKTRPQQQFPVARALRLRVLERLAARPAA